MNNLKKIIAVLLLAVMGLGLASCSSAPSACESCGLTGQKLTKVTYQGESAWLCPMCETLAQLIVN